jgi:hypothetical protein
MGAVTAAGEIPNFCSFQATDQASDILLSTGEVSLHRLLVVAPRLKRTN